MSDESTGSPYLLLDVMRRLRARERGYLAGWLHDGPMQELAAAPLLLAEARRATGAAQSDELGLAAQQLDAAGRSLRCLQDELWPFPSSAPGLATALRRRTAWLLDTPLAVDAGAGTAGLLEAEIQVVADVVELILVSAEAPARALAEVRADEEAIVLEMSMTPATASASVRRLAAVIGVSADVGQHASRLRVLMEIPRR